ncbi:MAG: sugar-binding domain-containing protein [Oligosphaeraceae bacterium]
MKKTFLMMLAVAALAWAGNVPGNSPVLRRQEMREAWEKGALSARDLARCLEEEKDPVLQGTLLRLMVRQGEEAVPFLRQIMAGHPLASIRVRAFLALWNIQGGKLDEDTLRESLGSQDLTVRRLAVQSFVSLENPSEALRQICEELLKTERDDQIRQLLVKASWPFHRNVALLKDRPDWDHEVVMKAEYPLPLEGWAFSTDPLGNLHSTEEVYREEFDDAGWRTLEIGKTWEACGVAYDGIAWYRRTFDVPEKPAVCHAVELRFDSVDESTWVWINGQYVGEHDLGPVGWNVPFSLDVTDLIRWGEPNQITVRVQDVGGAGGIYKPIKLQVME